MPPRLSIGLPVYNRERFLGETLQSLRSQTFTDFELIISDNASTDGTETICRAAAKEDPRIHYHRNARNLGLTRNFNQVFSMAKGEYFKWAASDDVCLPDYLARCIAALDLDAGIVLAYPRTRFVDASGNTLHIGDPGWHLMSADPYARLRYVIRAGHWVNSILGVIRSEALSRTRLLPGYPGGDYNLLAELSLQGRFYEVPEILYLRRLHDDATGHHKKEVPWMVEYWGTALRTPPMPSWNRNVDHLRTVLGSTLPWHHKVDLSMLILDLMRQRRERLWREVWIAIAARGRRAPEAF